MKTNATGAHFKKSGRCIVRSVAPPLLHCSVLQRRVRLLQREHRIITALSTIHRTQLVIAQIMRQSLDFLAFISKDGASQVCPESHTENNVINGVTAADRRNFNPD